MLICIMSPSPASCCLSCIALLYGAHGMVEDSSKPYLEGQGDLVSRFIMGILRVTIWVIKVIY